jgi:hypothetical protein
MAINKVPQIWQSGHVSLGDLWGLYCAYPYMQRLRDRSVLDDGVEDLPMIWETDAFALASSYDAEAERYVGLWLPSDDGPAPAATDSLLLVQPAVAKLQRENEVPDQPPGPGPDPPGPGPGPTPPPPVQPDFFFTRFYAVKTLDAGKIAMDFKNVADEILSNLREDGTNLVVKIEIEATKPTGFDDGERRTLSENASTLKFEQSGFEEK